MLGNLFDGLTAIDPSGAVLPAVAASWTSDPSLRRWEFRLRPDARWSDGSPVRSTDFTYAWHRLADPKTKPAPSPARTLLSGVTGYRSFAAGRARSIAGLEAPDPTTLVVRLDRPFADLPALVAALPLSPLPATLARPDPAAYLAQPVGNGPFRLAAPARPGRSLTLDRNPAYWGSPALLDKVSVHAGPRRADRLAGAPERPGLVRPRPPRPARRRPHRPRPLRRRPHHARPPPGPHPHHLAAHLQPQVEAGSRPPLAPGRLPGHRPRPARHRPGRLAGDHAWSPPPPPAPGRRAAVAGPPRPARPAATTRPRPAPCSPGPRSGGAPVTLAIPPGADARRVAALARRRPRRRRGRRWSPTPTPTGETPLTLVRRVAPYPRPDPFLAAPSSTSPDGPAPPRPGPRHPRRPHPRNPLPAGRSRHPGRPPRHPPPHRAPRRRPHPRPPGLQPHPLGHPRPGHHQPPRLTLRPPSPFATIRPHPGAPRRSGGIGRRARLRA